MKVVASPAQVRLADAAAAAAVGEGVLIERAAAAAGSVAAGLLDRVYGARVAVLAGSGHNGADALRVGARLARRGAAVVLVRSSDRDGDVQLRAALADALAAGAVPAAHPLTRTDGVVHTFDLVVDGMTGAGAHGPLSGRAAELAGWARGQRVLAIDLPSGVEGATGGVPGPAVQATATVAFGALRPAHVIGPGAELCGVVVCAGLGLAVPAGAVGVLEPGDVAPLLADPGPAADKYSRGVVGVRAGGAAYPGAAVLCTGGAVRAGAGYVRYVGGAAQAVQAAWPTVVVGAGRVDAWVCGPGLAVEPGDLDAVRAVLDSDTPAVLDAGALAVGAEALRGRAAPTLLTPHAGEFSRLTGIDPAADPLGAARRAAAELGVHVLLKGQRTVVAAPDGRALVNPTGCTWLSTAGTGDVLAGACGALLAAAAKRGSSGPQRAGPPAPDLLTVAATAAFLHGLAGRFAAVPLAATDLLEQWAAAVAAVRSPE